MFIQLFHLRTHFQNTVMKYLYDCHERFSLSFWSITLDTEIKIILLFSGFLPAEVDNFQRWRSYYPMRCLYCNFCKLSVGESSAFYWVKLCLYTSSNSDLWRYTVTCYFHPLNMFSFVLYPPPPTVPVRVL